MKKLQQFFILKFQSDRLKKAEYKLDISLDNARKNGEIITITNSELLRRLFLYKNKEFNQKQIDDLLITQKKLKKAENSEENRRKTKENLEKIEKILFVEDLINVEFSNKAHYREIIKRKGFYVNGTRYVPFLASAGMIRKNTAMFINNNIKHPLMDILENGRDETIPLVPAKFGAYFSLYASSTLPVSFPRFAVVPDKEIKRLQHVDLVTYRGDGLDDDVTEQDYLLKANAWDGQGLITPRLAEQWSQELELDYTFSCAIIRAPFLKGLVVNFDLERFAAEVANEYTFVDLYGNEHDIRDIDLIVSESMFKLGSCYKSTAEYTEKCDKNKLGFSIAKVNGEREKSYSRTSYQFLQILNLSDADIADLCEPTLNWFRDIQGDKPTSMILYATGENNLSPEDFKKIDVVTKALMILPEISHDKYIQNRFASTIEKKKKESYMGNLLINANYQFMIGDPYYQACHIFKLDKEPLLKENQHYSEYWQKRGLTKVGAIRSPIVHHSEFNVLNLQERDDTKKWYSNIHSGIIFPANGIGMDCAIHGGSDMDGDLVCTINNPVMISGRIHGIPIVYESKKSEKSVVDSRDDASQAEYQLNGHNSKVGFATNISSSLYCLLEEFPMGSRERDTILKRLKIGRVIQGEIIDSVKGLKIPPFRNHWVKYIPAKKDMTPDELAMNEFNNRIVCEIRPSFFRFLYPHYMSRYNKEIKKYDTYSKLVFGKPFEEIYKKPGTEDEEKIVAQYKKRSFFLENNSVVNRICKYMRSTVGLIAKYSTSHEFDYKKMQSNTEELNVYNLLKMKAYLQEYKAFKRGTRGGGLEYETLEAFISYLRKECFTNISSNETELANYAIQVTYGDEISMVEFAWRLFGEGILQNLVSNSGGTFQFPVADENGDITYLWSKYSLQEFEVEDLYAD